MLPAYLMYFQRSLCHLCHLYLLYRLYSCDTSCIKRRKGDGRPLALIRPGNEAAPLALRDQPGRKEQGLVKTPHIFLAPTLLSSLAHVLDKSALYGKRTALLS